MAVLPSGDGDEIRGAAAAAPRTDPLTLVAAAVAGTDLQAVARSAADALQCPVAIALPAVGRLVLWPLRSGDARSRQALHRYASALAADADTARPKELGETVPVRLGGELLGVVASFGPSSVADDAAQTWLKAAATAAAVTALVHDAAGVDAAGARRAFLQTLERQAPADVETLLAQARRLGCDLSLGAIAICASVPAAAGNVPLDWGDGLVTEVASRFIGLLPLVADRDGRRALELAARLRSDGGVAVLSAPRRGPEDLAGALREAGLLFELALEPNPVLQANEETIRLLVGILLRDPEALRRLQALTVAELERYDEVHDTGLIATLEGFLAHHGSTTETAEAMNLHRHTVGYRLARVQEVSGLSPYESDGRERLSLGLKAHRILQAEERWLARSQAV